MDGDRLPLGRSRSAPATRESVQSGRYGGRLRLWSAAALGARDRRLVRDASRSRKRAGGHGDRSNSLRPRMRMLSQVVKLGKGRQQKSACWERVLGPGRTWCGHGWVARNASRSRHPAIDNPAVGCMQQIAAQQQHKEMRVQCVGRPRASTAWAWEGGRGHCRPLRTHARRARARQPRTSTARRAQDDDLAPRRKQKSWTPVGMLAIGNPPSGGGKRCSTQSPCR